MTRKVIVCNLCCLCYEYRFFGQKPLSKPSLFLWKKALKHSKKYSVSGYLKQDSVRKKNNVHTFNLEKAFSFGGLRPPPPPPHTKDNAPGPHRGPQKASAPTLSGFLTFLHFHFCLRFRSLFLCFRRVWLGDTDPCLEPCAGEICFE